MYTRRAAALSLLLLTATVPAQDQTKPLVELMLAGPKAIRQAILPTNAWAALGGPECRPLWKMLDTEFQSALRRSDTDGEWTALRTRLLGYSGRIEGNVFVTHAGRRPQIAGHMLLWADGHTDMAALRKEIREVIVGLAGGKEPRAARFAGDRFCEIYGREKREGITLPMAFHEDHMVVFFGTRIDDAIRNGLQHLDATWPQRQARAAAKTPNGQLLRVAVDLRQVAALIDAEIRNAEEKKLMRMFIGTPTWDRGFVTVSTVGPRLQLEVRADFTPGGRGVIDGLLPDISTLPATAFRLPHGTAAAPVPSVAAHLRLNAIYDAYFTVLSNLKFLNAKGRTVAQLKAEANEQAGFDIERDLLAHVGSSVLAIAQLAPGAQDRANPDADGLCFAIPIKDDAAFARSYGKLLKMRELRAGAPVRKHGMEVVPVRFLDRGEYFARVPGMFLYAIGERGLAAMKTVLATPKLEGESTDAKLPRSIERLRRQMPPGCNAIGVLPTNLLADSLAEEVLWEIWREVRYEFPRDLRDSMSRETLSRRAAALVPILDKYRLNRIQLLGGFETSQDKSRRSARIRLVW